MTNTLRLASSFVVLTMVLALAPGPRAAGQPPPAPEAPATPAPTPPANSAPVSPTPVNPGIDALLADPALLQGKRVGLVTHQAGITANGRLTAAVLSRAESIRLTALFAPEHGIDGTYDAGETVPTVASRTSRAPVYSLYGGTLRPTRQMLDRIDVLVIDLQDVGVRAFTYTATMALVMQAAKDAGKPVVVLDRPNPLGGTTVDGPVLERQFRSFIGMYPIPYVFGMTIGELARLYNGAFGIGAALTVVPMQGWARQMTWDDTKVPWVNPSPGITGPEAVAYYAATGPLDGTNLWNGVATESRFRVIVAPWIDGTRLAERLNRYKLPGVRFAASAIPHPRSGRIWRGVRLDVTDVAQFKPSTTTVYVLAEIRRMYGNKLIFAKPRRGPYLFDLVWGTKDLRLSLSRGDTAATIVARWQPGLQRFLKLREAYLLYK